MSKKFLDELVNVYLKGLGRDGDLETCEEDEYWNAFLLGEAAGRKIEFQIRDVHGFQHAPIRRPFQLEIPTPDDDEFESYVVAFFGTEHQARKWAKKNNLTVKDGLAKI